MDVLLSATGANAERFHEALGRQLPGARIHRPPTEVACDYALVWKPPEDPFAGQTRLKAVFNIGAGVDAIIDHPGLPAGVPLIRLEDAGMASQMVEYVTFGVLQHLRSFDRYAAQAARGEWRALPVRPTSSFTVGILGLGLLGRAIADGLRPFGLRLAAWSRSRHDHPGVTCLAGAHELDTFLRHLDVLVVMVPLTPETRGLIDAARLAALPRGAALINVARGGVIVDADLLAALDSGHIGNAMLDVFTEEPLPPDHRFWRHPRVRVTPHVSAVTLVDESIRQIVKKILAMERGDTVSGVVLRSRGY